MIPLSKKRINKSQVNNISKVDLHIHSNFSKNSNDWRYQLFGVQESYSKPASLYKQAQTLGFDFFTLTDHDSIDGNLELAHHKNVFISEEISTWFPDENIKIHIVVLNISEAQHREIQQLKKNIFDLTKYLNNENILHYVAHPLHSIMEPVQLMHFEKMLLLFNIFENNNGNRPINPQDLLEHVFIRLTPEKIWHLADKYDINPIGETPWIKSRVGGSDDHSGLFLGNQYTVMPKAKDVNELLGYIKSGQSKAIGKIGSYKNTAHSILSVGYQHVKKSKKQETYRSEMTWKLLSYFLENSSNAQSPSLHIFLFFNKYLNYFENPSWKKEFIKLVRPYCCNKKKSLQSVDINEKLWESCRHISYHLIKNVLDSWDNNDYTLKNISRLKALQALIPIFIPYAVAIRSEYKDRLLMRKVSNEYLGLFGVVPEEKIAAFTDLCARHTEKSRTFKQYLSNEFKSGKPIDIYGLGDQSTCGFQQKNFKPFASQEIKDFILSIPPFFEIIEQLLKEDYSHIYIHTFHGMGMVALIFGKLLDIHIICRYPYLTITQWLSNCHHPEQRKIVSTLLKWIFSSMEEIRVHSEKAKEQAISIGIPEKNIHIVQKEKLDI